MQDCAEAKCTWIISVLHTLTLCVTGTTMWFLMCHWYKDVELLFSELLQSESVACSYVPHLPVAYIHHRNDVVYTIVLLSNLDLLDTHYFISSLYSKKRMIGFAMMMFKDTTH